MLILHYYNSQTDAAVANGVTRQAIQKWMREGVPAERVLPFCEKTVWKVTPHMLRPDLYPNPSDAIPLSIVKEAA